MRQAASALALQRHAVSADLFVTAGHCAEPPAAHVEIWFDDGFPIPVGNPGNVLGYPFTGDVGGPPFRTRTTTRTRSSFAMSGSSCSTRRGSSAHATALCRA